MLIEEVSSGLDSVPALLVKNGIVAYVSRNFAEFTGFDFDEMINITIDEAFKRLRTGPNVISQNLQEDVEYFLFTKALEVKFVNIKVINTASETQYLFIQRHSSSLESRFPLAYTLYKDNHYGVGIFSIPDLTLLAANHKHICNKDIPENNIESCIGRKLTEFASDFTYSSCKEVLNKAIRTGKSQYIDEYVHKGFNEEITYWQISMVPMLVDNKPKYCVVISIEITDQVLDRKKKDEQTRVINLQNDRLKWQADLLDLSSEAILAWDLNGGIIFWNTGAQQLYGYSKDEAVGSQSPELLQTVFPCDFNTFKAMLERNGSWKGTLEHTGKSGERMIISTNIQLIQDETGQAFVLETNRDVTENVRLQEKIVEQKKELENIIDSIDDAIFIYDRNHNYYLVNASARKYFQNRSLNKFGDGYEAFEYYDYNGNKISMENMIASKVLHGQAILNDRITVKMGNNIRHVSVNGRPIYDSQGNVKFAVTSGRDLTHDIETQKLIEQQNIRLEAVIQNVSDGLLLLRKDQTVKFLNDEAKNFALNALYRSEEGIYSHVEYLDREGKPIANDDLPSSRALEGEKIRNFFLTVKRVDRTIHYNISASPIYDLSGNLSSALLCTSDITESVNNEKKLEEQKEQLQAILDNMQESVLVFDKSGKYVTVNKVAKQIYKDVSKVGASYSYAKYLDMDGKELTQKDNPANKVRQGEFVKDCYMHLILEEKDEYVSVSGTPVLDKDGSFLYGIMCSRNVSDFMKSEQALKQTQVKLLEAEREKRETLEKALEMKDEFLTLISHEFRTPLNVINTAIQTMNLLCGSELSDKAKKYLSMIRQNTFRQLRLVNNLLDITRANAGSMKINRRNIDISFLTRSITESVQAYASQKGLEVTYQSDLNEKIIGMDDEKYERILLNLLSNAIKFTPKGKSICVRLNAENNKIKVEVQDKGIGIPDSKAEVIFERFGQVDSSLSRQAEGSGIGLSLVKKFVEALNGTITVASKVGQGSTFTFLLPDERIEEESFDHGLLDLMDNRLVQTADVEFSDIYL